jgi:dienelactone hydrolase
LLLSLASMACGQDAKDDYKPPRGVTLRRATVVSEDSRLHAEAFAPDDKKDTKLPTIILCHGWGGTAAMLRQTAVAFAKAGYLAVTFDYRGWGKSEGRLVATKPLKRGKPGEPFTAEVKEVREVVDPLDQTTDLLNVIHWVQGEKRCDTKRLGLWGTSYSGGHVVYVAARDPRVRATVSQVPALDSRWVMLGLGRVQTLSEATRRARGELGYPKAGAKFGGLTGVPVRERLINYAPVEDVEKAKGCAMLFILAEKEELFDNKDHGIKAHARAKGPKKLVVIPKITHYGVYKEAREQALKHAIDWYDKHLKGERKPEVPK